MKSSDPFQWTRYSTTRIVALLLPLFLIALIRIIGFQSENSVDCYYHIYMADAGPSVYMDKEFSKLTMSTWTKGFSDKELGFHLLLSGIRELKAFVGLSSTVPFNTEALFFAYFAAFAFIYLLWYFKVDNIFYYTLLLIIVSPFFTNRLLMLRPHNLSIALMILAIPILHSIHTRRQLWRAFILGFCVSWCYSNPHFILLPGCAMALAFVLKNRKIKLAILALFSLFCGILLGYIIHPQFPNTFINWKIQCIDVIMQALFHSSNISLGKELHPPSMRWLGCNSLPIILFFVSLLFVYKIIGKKKSLREIFTELPTHIIAIGLILLVSLVALFAGIRAMEYVAPFSILFVACTFQKFRKRKLPLPYLFTGKNIGKYAKLLVIVIGIAFTVFQIDKYRRQKGFKPLDDFSEWSATSAIPKNAIIANLIWSDFAFLIYSTPQYRYICGQEPMFSYAMYPREMEDLELLRTENIQLTPQEVAKIANAKYAFIRKPYKRYAKYLIKLGFTPIYSGKDGWLFNCNTSLPPQDD